MVSLSPSLQARLSTLLKIGSLSEKPGSTVALIRGDGYGVSPVRRYALTR